MTAEPANANTAAAAQPSAGPRGWMGAPAVAALISKRAATPSAVPSWAAVFSAAAATA
jgi:hypothetical protein